jgi:urease accessory protein
MRALAGVTAELVGGRVALSRIRSDPPLAIRQTGPARVHLVGTAAGPLAGDDVCLDLVVRAGAELTVSASAATVALRGVAGRPSSLHVRAVVEDGARLWFLPQPTVAAAGCDHLSRTTVELADGASLVLREELVAGRSCDDASGLLRSSLGVDRAGLPVLHQTLTVGRPLAGAAVAARRCVGTLLVVGPGGQDGGWSGDAMDFPAPDTVVCALASPGAWLATAMSADAAAIRRQLDAAQDHLDGRCLVPVPDGTIVGDRTGASGAATRSGDPGDPGGSCRARTALPFMRRAGDPGRHVGDVV